MTALAAAAPGVAMVACFACLIGGGTLVWTGRDRRKGVLLLVMAAVLVVNVAIWTL